MPIAILDKHVGEMDVDETRECLTDPSTRIIHQVKVEDTVTADKLFDQLMGETVVYRKQFLKQYAEWSEYNVE